MLQPRISLPQLQLQILLYSAVANFEFFLEDKEDLILI